MKTSLLFVLCSGVITSHAEQSNPLGKVIDLIDELAAKVTKDGEAEVAAYKEFFEWCDDTSKNLQHEIKTGSAQQGKLEAKIEELASEIEDADAKIEELAAAIAKVTKELDAATEIRNKEEAEFTASEKELVDAVDTLGRAMSVLEREASKNPAAFAQVDNTNMKTLLQTIGTVMDAAAFPGSDKQKLLGLIQSRDASDDENEDLGAPAAASYKSHSSTIIDAIGDMKEKAEGELGELRQVEMKSAHNYDMLKQALDDKTAADNKEMAEQKSNKATAEETKAESEGELDVTVKDLKAARDGLATTQSDCMTTAADHEASLASRAEELKVIAEAKKILLETTSGASEQTYSFLQLTSRVDLANSEVSALVKKLAKEQHSAALSQLASRIQAVARMGNAFGANPFGKIKGLIEDMIAKLESEADKDAEEKAFCDEAMSKTEAKKGELEDDVDSLTGKIDQAAAKSAELKVQVTDLQEELANLAKTQKELDTIRRDENEAYKTAKADLELGLGGVRKALSVLRDYYGGSSAAFLQDSDSMEQPAVPSHSASGGAGGGIINILEVCESDFADTLAKTETEEADSQSSYDKITQENTVAKTQKDQDVKYKTKEFNTLDKNVADMSSDRGTIQKELDAVNEYYSKLKGRCVAKPETYEERKKRREAEIAGLKEALSILENESAFLQRKRKGGHMRGSMQ